MAFIQEQDLLSPGNRILVACSGGVDSVALLHFLAINRKVLRVEVAAVHVDHMLRGFESAADGLLVSDLCKTLDVAFFGGSVPVPELIKSGGGNVQTVCRNGRYDFFAKVMSEHRYDVLVTAHHAEDQLETVLMQVTKGVTPSGIPIKRDVKGGVIVRPFLPLMKDALYSYVEQYELAFHEDPSNNSDDYMRNRFRRHITPLILAENQGAAERVVAMTSNIQEDENFLKSLAKKQLLEIVEFTDERLPSVNRVRLSRMPTALQRRMITLLLGYLYDKEDVPIYYKIGLVDQLFQQLHSTDGSTSIDLPQGYQFIREYDELKFIKLDKNLSVSTQKEMPRGLKIDWEDQSLLFWAKIDEVDISTLTHKEEIMYFDLPEVSFPLSVRGRKDGDRMLLPGMDHAKRLSRLFIDEKVSKTERDLLPIIVTAQDEVCAVPGLRYGVSFTKKKTDASKYIFVFEKC